MSIDVNVQNDLVIVTESSEDITVNVSNAAGPAGANGVGVPVGGTTGQVLKKFTNTNYDTYWASDASGLTSVGLSMPNAFAVSNSPLTSNGTIAVTGAGTADQYVRGDGQLANFPTNNGGGSSVNYYLNGSVSQGTFGGDTYYEMSKTPIIGAGTNFTRTNAQGNGYIASFITDAGDPALLNIPGGNWNIEFYFAASSGGGTPSFYNELYKVSSSNVFTLIASGSTNPEGITQGTVVDQYFTSIPVPQTALLATDRIAIRIFVTPSGRNITLHTEDNNLCEVLTTFSTGLNALNGLTAQVQYFATGTSGTDFAISSATDTHTFNLPTASGTNRGALSSADWTTFSGKVGGSGASGQVAYWNGTSSQTGSNNLFWDAATARLGIGLNTPTSPLFLYTNTSSTTVADNSGFILHNNNPSQTVGNLTELFFSDAGQGTGTANGLNLLHRYAGISGFITGWNFTNSSGGLNLFTRATNGSFITTKLQIRPNGNVLIQDGGTFTDGGQRLQVYGDAFIKGSGATSATNALLVQNSAGLNSFRILNNTLAWFYSTLRIGNTTSAPLIFNQTNVPDTGDVNGTNLSFYSYTGSQSASSGRFFFGGENMVQTTGANYNINSKGLFFPTSGTATFADIFINPQISQTGGANGITRGLYVNPTLTAAADWRSIEWSNNSGWGLYGAGTSNNFLQGATGVGTSTMTYKFNVTDAATYVAGFRGSSSSYIVIGDTSLAGASGVNFKNSSGESFIANVGSVLTIATTSGANTIAFSNSGTERMRLTNAGRLLLGLTTEGTFLLDVNGTARVSGVLTFANASTGGTDSLFIGVGNISPFGGLRNVQIGNFGGVIFTGSRNVAIGSSTISAGNSNSITIGNANTNNGGFAIGYSCTSSNNGIAFGQIATSNFLGSCVIGTQYGASSTASDQFVVESPNWYLGSVLVSNATTNAVTINGQSGSGTNINANTFTINGGRGTGSGTSGDVVISTATTTTSGTTLQSLTERLRIKGTQGSVRFIPIATPTTAEAGDVYYDSSTNKLRCYNGTTWNDLF